MRRFRRLRPSRRRGADRARPARAAASRPGGGGHRLLRRAPFPRPARRRPGRPTTSPAKRGIAQPARRRAIGHNRYSTTGGSVERNIQPLFARLRFGGFAVAHNGNLTNARAAAATSSQRRGSIFQSTTDTEVIVHLIATSTGHRGRPHGRCPAARSRAPGRWSPVDQEDDRRAATPSACARWSSASSTAPTILASETCALDIIGARFVRDVEAGEMVIITEDGIESL